MRQCGDFIAAASILSLLDEDIFAHTTRIEELLKFPRRRIGLKALEAGRSRVRGCKWQIEMTFTMILVCCSAVSCEILFEDYRCFRFYKKMSFHVVFA